MCARFVISVGKQQQNISDMSAPVNIDSVIPVINCAKNSQKKVTCSNLQICLCWTCLPLLLN